MPSAGRGSVCAVWRRSPTSYPAGTGGASSRRSSQFRDAGGEHVPKFVVIAEFEVSPPDRARVLEVAQREAAAVHRLEPAGGRFDVAIAVDEPGRGVFYEVFEHEAAFEHHKQTDHFARFFEEIAELDVKWNSNRYQIPD